MIHATLPRFWAGFEQLPEDIQQLALRAFDTLKTDPDHPSLHLKKVGRTKQLWFVRVGIHYRALGKPTRDGILWFWIGGHAEYDLLIS